MCVTNNLCLQYACGRSKKLIITTDEVDII